MRKAIHPWEPKTAETRRTSWTASIIFMVLSLLIPSLLSCTSPEESPLPHDRKTIKLPEPRYQSDVSVEEALLNRRSVRDYSGKPLTIAEVSQLLWAAQGITDPRGFRTAPSAGALYPLEVYVVVGNVGGLAPGVYRYSPQGHKLVKIATGDRRAELAQASLNQEWVGEGAIDLVFTAIYERTTQKYGDRGIRYVHMEAGHAAENVYLQAEALGLGMVVVGAFRDKRVKDIISAPAEEQPLYVVPVGRKR